MGRSYFLKNISYFVAQASFQLSILLSLLPKCWNYRWMPTYLVIALFFLDRQITLLPILKDIYIFEKYLGYTLALEHSHCWHQRILITKMTGCHVFSDRSQRNSNHHHPVIPNVKSNHKPTGTRSKNIKYYILTATFAQCICSFL